MLSSQKSWKNQYPNVKVARQKAFSIELFLMFIIGATGLDLVHN